MEDAIRLEIVRNQLGRQVNATDADISMDQLRSEGWRRWNADLDIEYQYEIFNGLPVYYGGDKYDSDDSEEFLPQTSEETNNDEDFTDTDVNSDTGSDMKFDCSTRKPENPRTDADTDICTHAGKKENVNHRGVKNTPEEDACVVNNVNDWKLGHGLTAAGCVNAGDPSYIAECFLQPMVDRSFVELDLCVL